MSNMDYTSNLPIIWLDRNTKKVLTRDEVLEIYDYDDSIINDKVVIATGYSFWINHITEYNHMKNLLIRDISEYKKDYVLGCKSEICDYILGCDNNDCGRIDKCEAYNRVVKRVEELQKDKIATYYRELVKVRALKSRLEALVMIVSGIRRFQYMVNNARDYILYNAVPRIFRKFKIKK